MKNHKIKHLKERREEVQKAFESWDLEEQLEYLNINALNANCFIYGLKEIETTETGIFIPPSVTKKGTPDGLPLEQAAGVIVALPEDYKLQLKNAGIALKEGDYVIIGNEPGYKVFRKDIELTQTRAFNITAWIPRDEFQSEIENLEKDLERRIEREKPE